MEKTYEEGVRDTNIQNLEKRVESLERRIYGMVFALVGAVGFAALRQIGIL